MSETTNLDLLLSKLTKVSRRGKEWVAACPAHADSTPSLGVRVSDTGKILLHCMADCAPSDILSAIGMELADLFPDRKLNGHVQPAIPAESPTPERITCPPPLTAPTPKLHHPVHGTPSMLHVYKDVDNRLLGYVMRFDGKDGKTFCPLTFSLSDGWQLKGFSKPRPLYGLDRMAARVGNSVIVCEGEKAADAAQRLCPHNACLSWPGGASSWKHADWSKLNGLQVILWPDADDVGLTAMEGIAELLQVQQCQIRMIDVYDLKDGFDAADLKDPIKTWLPPRLRTYKAVGSAKAIQQTPKDSDAPVAAPAKPQATVTPIAEARTKAQKKPKVQASDDYAPFADDVLARAFTATHPDLRYVARWGKWMQWTDGNWREDDTLQVYDLARKVCVAIADETRGASTAQVNAAKSAGKRAAVENLARADRVHAISADVWDADKLKLNTPGGLVDLSTGLVRPTRIDDYCRKITTASLGTQPPVRWLEFLNEATDGDAEEQSYLRRLAGMCCTGDTREDFLGFIYGPGGNGKSVFIDTLQNILGTYAINAGIETFTEQKSDKHTTELARLYGARLVVAQETEQGRRWAESRLKLLTGGGKVTARFMRCDDFEFTPELKLVIVGNHKPSLRNVDAAFRRRFNLIPFVHTPKVIDKQLRAKLWEERDGILTWMVQGCLEWLESGLRPPAIVTRATEQYFDDQDILGQWIIESCETGTGCSSGIRTLHTSYMKFCKGREEFFLRQGEFKDALLTRDGITEGGYGKNRLIEGLRVRVEDTDTRNSSANGYMPD